MNKKISLAVGVGLLLILSISSSYFLTTNDKPQEKNYLVDAQLGVIPSAQSRVPTKGDIDTGIKFEAGDATYALIESRNFDTMDYGRTYFVRVE